MVEYFHQGKLRREPNLPADLTLLQYLRTRRGLTGTKEGCASGDCGACTVVLVELDAQGELVYRSVNSCLCPAAELQGRELITVEDLESLEGELHPIQQSFVEHHASQCGFCTPGFVMSAFALHKRVRNPDREQIEAALGGNLCRCTGYRPIIAAVADHRAGAPDQFDRDKTVRVERLQSLTQGAVLSADRSGLALPQTLDQLADQMRAWPEAEYVAGATDLALEITQRLKAKPRLIGLSRIAELKQMEVDQTGQVILGAGLTYTELLGEARDRNWSQIERFLLRIGSEPIRNRGTLGGNLSTASPVGDLAPLFLALDAELQLWSPKTTRFVKLSEFFVDYRKTVLQPGELIRSIRFYPPSVGLFAEKVSKRWDDDISTVSLCGSVAFEGARVSAVRLGFGGMAATARRAGVTEEALLGRKVGDLSVEFLAEQLRQEFTPMSDLRGSAEYRIEVSAALLLEALHRIAEESQHD